MQLAPLSKCTWCSETLVARQPIGSYEFGDAPGLGYAAFGFLGGVAVEYFRDAADAAVCGQMAEQRQDELGGLDLAFPAELVDL